jgi:hypothetical protein
LVVSPVTGRFTCPPEVVTVYFASARFAKSQSLASQSSERQMAYSMFAAVV